MAGSLNSYLWYSIVNGVPVQLVGAYGGGTLQSTLPSMTLAGATGARLAASLPSMKLSIGARATLGDQSAEFSMPSITGVGYGGSNLSDILPSMILSATGTVWGRVGLDVELPSLQLTASGTVSSVGRLSALLPAMTLRGFDGSNLAAVLPAISISARGLAGGALRMTATLPMITLSASATARSVGRLNATLPMLGIVETGRLAVALPAMRLTGLGSAVVAVTYEAYATNLKHIVHPNQTTVDEVTHYTNFPFTHVVRYKDKYYGANATGLFALEGPTDDGVAIPWALKTNTTDFDSIQHKTVASAYFGGRMGAASTITLYAGEGAQTQAYAYTTPRGALAQNYRQKFGKGIRHHRYYAVGANGSGELMLDTVNLDVHTLARRI